MRGRAYLSIGIVAAALAVTPASAQETDRVIAPGDTVEAEGSAMIARRGTAGSPAIVGTVVDAATGEPVAGAQISIPGTGLGAATGPDGRFRVAAPAGEHRLQVEHLGHAAVVGVVRVPDDAALELAVRLAPSAIEVEEIEAEAETERTREERRRTATVRTITAEEIAEYPATTITDLLPRFVPGLHVARNPDTGCPIVQTGRRAPTLLPGPRGGREGDVAPLIVLDGIPSQDPCTLDLVDPDEIEKMEFHSSMAAAARWGFRGRGGVLVITTKSGRLARSSEREERPGRSWVAINPYAGHFGFDGESLERTLGAFESGPLFGIRVSLGGGAPITGDIAYGRFAFDVTTTAVPDVSPGRPFDEDTSIHLLYGALGWHPSVGGPVDLFLSAGAGVARVSPARRDGSTDLLLNYGAGASFPVAEKIRIRADLKDHVQLCDEPDSFQESGACLEEETLHNVELSVGVVLDW